MKIRQVAALGLSVILSSCGSALFPRTVQLGVTSVTLPATIGAGEEMTVGVRYGVGCGDYAQRVVQVARTASRLTLTASGMNRGQNMVCPAVYVEQTITYTDPGTPARTAPFEVVVNGTSWGTVGIH